MTGDKHDYFHFLVKIEAYTQLSLLITSFLDLALLFIIKYHFSKLNHYLRHSGIDPSTGRRKNATRETTAALKAWLKEHKKNPYPTKAEKIMLAIITRMTLTQVSTWFANARRRLKKEHKGEFSSDTSFDAISTSSDDEDSTKTDTSLQEGKIPAMVIFKTIESFLLDSLGWVI